MWEMPDKDLHATGLFHAFETAFKNPKSLAEFVDTVMIQDGSYIAVFICRGHGAMLRLLDNPNLGKLLHLARDRILFTLTIYHGPAAFLAADTGNSCVYKR